MYVVQLALDELAPLLIIEIKHLLNHCPLAVTFTNGTLTALTDNEELLLGIPISGDVQFTKDRNDAYLITTGFGWYGQSLYASSVSGQVQILFGAEPTEEAGIYRIGWNVTGAAPLDIRYNKPSGHRNLY